jgi:glutamyl-tRNA reductase
MIENFKTIAFTFKHLSFEQIGLLHKPSDQIGAYFKQFLNAFQLDELMYLSTCNRIEFFLVSEREVNHEFLYWFIHAIKPELTKAQIQVYIDAAEIHESYKAVEHLMRLSASLESMVVGEREIITQVRQSFDICKQAGLVGDTIRLIMRQTIEAAKQVYSATTIATNPVSVVSLAVRALQSLNFVDKPNVLILGAGQTIQNFANYLEKEVAANYVVFNRSLDKAKRIAQQLGGQAFDLSDLSSFNLSIDVIIACTGSEAQIIGADFIKGINTNKSLKMAIDLAIPADVDPAAVISEGAQYIGLNALELIAKDNLAFRQSAIVAAEEILSQHLELFESLYKERQIEKAFSNIPTLIKQAKDKALNEVFENEINQLDEQAKSVLLRAMNYLEKKANAAVMTVAKGELL